MTKEPSRRANRAPEASGEPREGAESATQPTRNKPLGFSLTLDPEHPYLAKRGIGRELAAALGLGYFAGARGMMVGRVCIPIHNAEGQLVAYAGRWAGPEEDLPEGEEKYKLPKGFSKNLELWNLHRVSHCRHLIVVEGYFGAMCLHGQRLPGQLDQRGADSAPHPALPCPSFRHRAHGWR
jgi:hypothetical protein